MTTIRTSSAKARSNPARRRVQGRSLALPVLILGASAFAQSPPLPAPQAVREGNRFLQGGDPHAALQRYGEAKQLAPDAREIAFNEGLAHYALGEFDQAREAFDRAAQGKTDGLADDAIYSAGTCDHAQAAGDSADPKQSLAKLEDAMQRYQSVLARDPSHPAARDAHYRASSLWRQLKQQMQQQQQQQQPNQQNDSKENQEKQEQSQEQQQPNEQQNQEQQQQEQQQESKSEQEQSQEQQQQAQAEQQEQQEEQEPQEAQESKEEEVSREQAERKLREIMQALKDRKKNQPQEAQKVQLQRVEKDW